MQAVPCPHAHKVGEETQAFLADGGCGGQRALFLWRAHSMCLCARAKAFLPLPMLPEGVWTGQRNFSHRFCVVQYDRYDSCCSQQCLKAHQKLKPKYLNIFSFSLEALLLPRLLASGIFGHQIFKLMGRTRRKDIESISSKLHFLWPLVKPADSADLSFKSSNNSCW